ncbi:hypothetical protein [Mucilaginibacter rubeus]|uniref:hypothetical protein n=1 Tax=Mucilaginibacter rubeus TaxID=2027860 RepID=UPI00166DFE14|nr:hypothetical protein [Mucilaginibacter rubeus]GGA97134.1 hypothetical protein GCM10011500_11280 [Mucilaginibacter rubeus]
MKTCFIFLFVIIGLSACKKDANDTAYDKSYKVWQNFKTESKNSYTIPLITVQFLVMAPKPRSPFKMALLQRRVFEYREFKGGPNYGYGAQLNATS